MRIGVLALQGSFAEHIVALGKLGVEGLEIRKKTDLSSGFDGLIFSGGESTVIGRLLHQTALFDPINELLDGGLPALGTCAGMILLAEKIENERISYFKSINITVKRNAYGRQLGSFNTTGHFIGIGNIPMTFIRAPYIVSSGKDVFIPAQVDGIEVAAESDNILVTAFHPELTDDLRVHRYFLDKVSANTCSS